MLAYLAQARAYSGDRGEALKILHRLQNPSKSGFVSPWDLALIYVALGDKKNALTYLEKAVDQHVGWVVRLGVDPALDPIRTEPQFEQLSQRIGIPQTA